MTAAHRNRGRSSADSVCATDLEDPWYPSASVVCEEGVVELRFDWLEVRKRSRSDDAEIIPNPNGDRLYAVWSQQDFGIKGALIGTDPWFRRVFYNLFTDGGLTP